MFKSTPKQKSIRQGRSSENELFYFFTAVTHNRIKIFLNKNAAEIVLNTLKWLDQKERINLIACVIMPDHLHFIAQLKETSIPKLMHSLKSYSANEINNALERKGHVWQSQYYERGIRNEKSLMDLVKYCLENPVRKGLADDFKDYAFWYCKYEI
jgi:REP element-mobilizing transposase RayT